MHSHQSRNSEIYNPTFPACAALPETSGIDYDNEKLSGIQASGSEPPELAERHVREHEATVARAPLFDLRLGSGFNATLKGCGSGP
jgi:hypothetical protein